MLLIVRAHTKIPVPEILAWSSDASNPVGAEYIIMEKASGVQLFQTWGTTNDSERFELVQRVTEIEGELASIRFPVRGSLYLCKPLDKDERQIELRTDVGSSTRFCIAQSCERQWHARTEAGTASFAPEFDRGPCELVTLLQAS